MKILKNFCKLYFGKKKLVSLLRAGSFFENCATPPYLRNTVVNHN
jgi:hypothetical protein